LRKLNDIPKAKPLKNFHILNKFFQKYYIDLTQSLMIGDSKVDIQCLWCSAELLDMPGFFYHPVQITFCTLGNW
jgi:hypothetical protein